MHLLSAIRDHDLHSHLISRTERKRIRYKKVAEGSDDEVADGDVVKGYAVKGGRYVVFDDGELARLAARKSRLIEIDRFVALTEIDPLFFEQPYRLVAAEHGAKPYRLLADVLLRTGQVGIAQMVMRGREHIVAVRSLSGMLIAHTLHFADEVLPGTAKASPAARVTERELAVAEKLVASMHDHFDPADFTDGYRARLQNAIRLKARGKTLAIEEEKERTVEDGKVINLMQALERSLQGSARGRKPRAAPASTRGRRTHRHRTTASAHRRAG